MTIHDADLVQIEKPVYGGACLARLNGKAVFVPLTLPGEQVRIHITEDKRGYSMAEVEEVVTPSPQRIAPACPHFGACGGCQYQHAEDATQLAWKQTILRETLQRGGVPVDCEIDVVAADPWLYRNRVRLAVDRQGNIGYRGRRSHAVVPIDACPIAAPLLLRAAKAFADELRESAKAHQLTELGLFCNATEDALLASVIASGHARARFDDVAAAVAQRIPQLQGAELILDAAPGKPQRTLAQWGSTSLVYNAAGFGYRVDQGAFFQVNRWLIDELVQQVTANRSGDLAWDLFAGVGLFARPLTRSFQRVVAVESAPASQASLRENLRGSCGEAVHAETLSFLRKQAGASRPDLIVVDPPRFGLGADTTSLLSAVAAPSIVYVSCDPATLARDLKSLVASGYSVASITLIDLFPQTYHLETMVQLCRS